MLRCFRQSEVIKMSLLTPEQMKMLIYSTASVQTLIDKREDELKQLLENDPIPDCPGLVRAVLDEIEKNHTNQ